MLAVTGDRILVDQERDVDKITPEGVILPETRHKPIVCGKVLAVGEGHLTLTGVKVPLPIEAGDIIFYHRSAGIELIDDRINRGDAKVVTLKYEEVLAYSRN